MPTILLVRHAETDFSLPRKWNTLGWGVDLAPLTPKGEQQVRDRGAELAVWKPDIVLVSPTTRTMNTALILKDYINAPFKVEFELHEWVPDKTFKWNDFSQVLAVLDEMRKCNGEWPDGKEQNWESLSQVKQRVVEVLSLYSKYARIMVICHGGVFWALTGIEKTDYVQSKEIQIN